MTQEVEIDITKLVPREKPKSDRLFPDTRDFTKRMIRKYYPELQQKLIDQ